ncbi:hypothetical protein [Hymenobacter terricola]|uniref:hypothetical protein n=1 Tax=Hymenobacter terricola TaxID=2819236 RepID=UPI001B300F00|nr:hypothetical protein [Hymenobacter terricola]
MLLLIRFAFLALLCSGGGCVSQTLVQHTRAYDAAAQASPEPFYLATTPEALQGIWGTKQEYYYTGSDSQFHYLLVYYDTYFKHKYAYKIPRNAPLGETPFDFTTDPTARKPLVLPRE